MKPERVVAYWIWVTGVLPVAAATPFSAFSGSYGATMGAGSVLGWERPSLEGNPAAMRPGNLGVSVAGYSPFALDAVSIIEAGVSLDGPRYGASVMARETTVDGGGSNWVGQVSEAAVMGFGFTAGASQRYLSEGEGNTEPGGVGGATGLRWNRFPFFGLGLMTDGFFSRAGREISTAAGFDFGGPIVRSQMSWRACTEGWFDAENTWRWRLGAALRLHSALSLYSGWFPDLETVALGVRFGMGRWEGFHALRRHAVLGTTSLQGLRWQRSLGSLNP